MDEDDDLSRSQRKGGGTSWGNRGGVRWPWWEVWHERVVLYSEALLGNTFAQDSAVDRAALDHIKWRKSLSGCHRPFAIYWRATWLWLRPASYERLPGSTWVQSTNQSNYAAHSSRLKDLLGHDSWPPTCFPVKKQSGKLRVNLGNLYLSHDIPINITKCTTIAAARQRSFLYKNKKTSTIWVPEGSGKSQNGPPCMAGCGHYLFYMSLLCAWTTLCNDTNFYLFHKLL